jgi:hypothetical protein
VSLSIRCKGTRNQSSKPGGPINENLTGSCKDMQSLDMEENENFSISNINNKVFRIIPKEHNFIFITEREKFGDQV